VGRLVGAVVPGYLAVAPLLNPRMGTLSVVFGGRVPEPVPSAAAPSNA
jgi:hypothetical protein